MILTAFQIYTYMHEAGFPPPVATTMVAIALRESGGDPNAFNGNAATHDRSYGLLQINMWGDLAAQRLKAFGITDEKQLLDPAVNAHAGFILWGGNNKNLETAWAIHLPVYRQRYEAHLPVAQNAALEFMQPKSIATD